MGKIKLVIFILIVSIIVTYSTSYSSEYHTELYYLIFLLFIILFEKKMSKTELIISILIFGICYLQEKLFIPNKDYITIDNKVYTIINYSLPLTRMVTPLYFGQGLFVKFTDIPISKNVMVKIKVLLLILSVLIFFYYLFLK